MTGPCRYPSLFQLNTRCRLTALSRELQRPATLDDIPDADLDRLAAEGFDWVWLLSVWQTGAAGQRVSRSRPEWRLEFEETLSDLCEDDIAGSGFAITGYTVHASLGGDAALARLRERLRARGLRLMLDFVPNHVALDHPWVDDHPQYSSRERTAISSGCPRTTSASNARRATSCSLTAAIRTSRVGPTPCSSITATRRRRTPCSRSC